MDNSTRVWCKELEQRLGELEGRVAAFEDRVRVLEAMPSGPQYLDYPVVPEMAEPGVRLNESRLEIETPTQGEVYSYRWDYGIVPKQLEVRLAFYVPEDLIEVRNDVSYKLVHLTAPGRFLTIFAERNGIRVAASNVGTETASMSVMPGQAYGVTVTLEPSGMFISAYRLAGHVGNSVSSAAVVRNVEHPVMPPHGGVVEATFGDPLAAGWGIGEFYAQVK